MRPPCSYVTSKTGVAFRRILGSVAAPKVAAKRKRVPMSALPFKRLKF